MKFLLFFSMLLTVFLAGCASRDVEIPTESNEPTDNFAVARKEVPTWDEQIPLPDAPLLSEEEPPPPSSPEEELPPPSLSESLTDLLSEEDTGYHFRKVKWGYSRERVELAEVGNTVHERTPEVLVYRCKVNDVNCALVYTFEKNKLRAAGYITVAPVPDAKDLTKAVVEKYGPPDGQETYDDGLNEMIWTTSHTVIFSNLYPSVTQLTPTPYDYTDGGLLKGLLHKQQSETQAGDVVYYDGVHAHIDKNFFYKLQTLRYPLDELSSYEKQLMGVTVRGKRTIIPGLGTIPR